MRYALTALITLFMFVLVRPILAQEDCGNGLPCGPVPWDLPVFPQLQSPTPIIVTANPSTPTTVPTSIPPTATAYIFPSPTPISDFSEIDDQVSTIQAMLEATDEVLYNIEGTPVSLSDPSTLVNDDSMLFFSYAKGFNTNTFGIISPVVNLLLFIMLTSMLWSLTTFSLPILSILIGIIRKIVQFIMDLLPG